MYKYKPTYCPFTKGRSIEFSTQKTGSNPRLSATLTSIGLENI